MYVYIYIHIYIQVFFFRFFSRIVYYNIVNTVPYAIQWGFPSGSDGKESAFSVGDLGSIHGLGRFPGKWNGYPLQYSCLEKSMDIGAWQTMVHGVTNSYT